MVFGVTGISTPFVFCDDTDGWRLGGICSMADDLGMDKSVIGSIPTANWFLVLELAKKRSCAMAPRCRLGSCAMAPRCRLGSYAMTPRAYHRWGDARASTLEPSRQADPGQSGHLSVRQAARIHPRGSCISCGIYEFRQASRRRGDTCRGSVVRSSFPRGRPCARSKKP